MKKVLVFFLVSVAGNAVASSPSHRSIFSQVVGILSDEDMCHAEVVGMVSGICNATMCRRLSVADLSANAIGATVTATLLMQLALSDKLLKVSSTTYALQNNSRAISAYTALPVVSSQDQLSRTRTCYVSNPNNSRALVSYKKEARCNNVNIRRNGRLQQPKK